MTTECYFGELPESLEKWLRGKLDRLDQVRAGSIFPAAFEDGMRYLLCQMLQDIGREKQLIEAYNKIRTLDLKRHLILNDLIHSRMKKEAIRE